MAVRLPSLSRRRRRGGPAFNGPKIAPVIEIGGICAHCR